MLLPLARYVRDKVLALEEHRHDASNDFDFSDQGNDTVTITTDKRSPGDTLADTGKEPAGTTDKASSGTDSPGQESAGALERRGR